MPQNTIKKIIARQIFDSRGNPTVEVDTILNNGIIGRAAVPSGASTGEYEAVELRDNKNYYMGKSVFNAVNNVNNIIAPALIGHYPDNFKEIDSQLIALDGTENKSNLGANALLGVSMSIVQAAAKTNQVELYEYLHTGKEYIMPIPMMNIINGGTHADNNVDIQEFMIYPSGLSSFSDAIQCGCEVFYKLKEVLKKKNYNTTVGDEGGFAPNLQSNQEALDLLSEAVIKSGYNLGKDIFFTLDVAASELFNKNENTYYLSSENKKLNSEEMIELYKNLCNQYPICSIEDGLDENDWEGWVKLNKVLGTKIQLVGDDLTVTNIKKLNNAINMKAINAILIKLNQIGTVSETLDTIKLAQESNFGVIISHRSGETEDTTISDLSVGVSSGQIKTGSLCRSERVAKYNQLLRIEEELNGKVNYG